jgi:hypothetical protein
LTFMNGSQPAELMSTVNYLERKMTTMRTVLRRCKELQESQDLAAHN